MRKLTCLFTMLVVVLFSQAQQKQLSGTVINKTTGSPLQGVTVQTKNKSVTSDANGKFSVEVVAGETITFTPSNSYALWSGFTNVHFKFWKGNSSLKKCPNARIEFDLSFFAQSVPSVLFWSLSIACINTSLSKSFLKYFEKALRAVRYLPTIKLEGFF